MIRIAALAAVMMAAACSSSGGDSERSIRVFAAASLTDVFDDIAVDFEQANPGTKVELVFAGSSSLVAQVGEGAPFDVLATADEITMQRAASANDVERPQVFATNIAVVVSQPRLADSPIAELSIAVCAPEVPCGRAATDLFEQLDLDIEPVTLEASVSGVLTKLALDEVDAGVVYATDLARTNADLILHQANQSVGVPNRYPVALAAGNTNSTAVAFVEYLFSAAAIQHLTEARFELA